MFQEYQLLMFIKVAINLFTNLRQQASEDWILNMIKACSVNVIEGYWILVVMAVMECKQYYMT